MDKPDDKPRKFTKAWFRLNGRKGAAAGHAKRTPEQLIELGRALGKASGEARRKKAQAIIDPADDIPT